MANQVIAAGLTSALARRRRVLSLGGYAVISHGHSRPTSDADLWLDPSLPIEEWCAKLRQLAAPHELR